MAGGFRYFKKLRRCNTCGYECVARYTSHTVWDKKLKKMVYCGNMRVVRDGDSKL